MTEKTTEVLVTLQRDHKHAGEQHAEGKTIAVPPTDATWLEAKGIGKLAASTAATEVADTTDTATRSRQR